MKSPRSLNPVPAQAQPSQLLCAGLQAPRANWRLLLMGVPLGAPAAALQCGEQG
jgi:hypothetical protein